jgi:putative regulator of septum formation
MMTVVMDLRTAPPRRSTGPAVAPRGPQPYPGARSRPPRRLVAGVLVGALTMLVVALLDTMTGAQVPVLGSFAALPSQAGQQGLLEVASPPATPGTCLIWKRSDASDTRPVDCAQTHLFEQAGTVQLADQKDLPDDGQWRQLVRERCDSVVHDYLGGKFDPDGRFRIGALKPSSAKWAQGDRELRCGLQSASRSGALYPMTGRAAEQDQSAAHDPGTCLAIDGRTIGDPVPCTEQHAVETVGVVDLTARFTDGFPAVEAQDEFLQGECTRIATGYAGGDEVIGPKKLTVYWDNLTDDSWKAGTRKVNCNLAALLPDRSGFAPVTGSVRGPVTVGDSPAPPAANTPAPGVPAQVPPVQQAPSPTPETKPAPASSSPTPAPAPPSTDAPPLDGKTPEPSPTPSANPAPSDEPGEPPLPPASTQPDLHTPVGTRHP